jgi:hypothetical protein
MGDHTVLGILGILGILGGVDRLTCAGRQRSMRARSLGEAAGYRGARAV